MARGIADIYFNPSRGGTPYRTGYVDRPQQILSDRRRPNYLSTPRFVDGRIIAPDQTRALGSSMSGPDALSRSGINSLPSSGSTQGINRMQSMGNALGNMIAGANTDPRNPLNSFRQSTNIPSVMPASTQNANANRDRATLQGLTNVDLGRVSSEMKTGAADVGNRIMGMVSDTYASVMGKMPSPEEMQVMTKNAIDKFKSVDTRLKQTSADISKLATAAVRSAVQEITPSGVRSRTMGNTTAGTMGMDPYTAEDNMGPNILNKGSSEYRIKQMLNNAIPREQSDGGINSLGGMRQDPRKFGKQPTQRPPRVFMEDGGEIGSGQGGLPPPAVNPLSKARADASMMSSVEGAVPDGMATPLPAAKIDPTDSELNAGMDQSTDTAKEEPKSIMDFANMGMVEFGLRMMASGSPTALGAVGQAGKEMIEANTIREERKSDRDFKTSMLRMSQEFTGAESDKDSKLKIEEIKNAQQSRKEKLRLQAKELGFTEKLTNAQIKSMDAEEALAIETLGISKEKLMTTELGQRRSLFQSLIKSTADYVTASLESNYAFNQLPPEEATKKGKALYFARLQEGMNHPTVKALMQSPEAIKLTNELADKQFGGKGGSRVDFTFTKKRGFQSTKAD